MAKSIGKRWINTDEDCDIERLLPSFWTKANVTSHHCWWCAWIFIQIARHITDIYRSSIKRFPVNSLIEGQSWMAIEHRGNKGIPFPRGRTLILMPLEKSNNFDVLLLPLLRWFSRQDRFLLLFPLCNGNEARSLVFSSSNSSTKPVLLASCNVSVGRETSESIQRANAVPRSSRISVRTCKDVGVFARQNGEAQIVSEQKRTHKSDSSASKDLGLCPLCLGMHSTRSCPYESWCIKLTGILLSILENCLDRFFAGGQANFHYADHCLHNSRPYTSPPAFNYRNSPIFFLCFIF